MQISCSRAALLAIAQIRLYRRNSVSDEFKIQVKIAQTRRRREYEAKHEHFVN
ncbi:Uncharacterized protein APZ42_012404 [Daphnia magna]|uniref:Uncharacterized protein n=1 Tax=Daphnia magna TaxID=35525 RepID=A0A162RRV8_9CRUS|nr:Uncharacterized protein APZ42_012404 [Daphnia magna]